MSWWQRHGPVTLARRFGALLWSPRQWLEAVTYNLPLKILSLAIAFALWSFVNFGERDAEETLRVPLELRNIPSGLMITSPKEDFVEVRVVGPRTLLGRIDQNRLAIPLDLGGVKAGPAVFRLSSDSLVLPRGVRVVRITPAQVTLELERVASKTVPVRLRFAGRLPAYLQITETKVAPEMVEVSGPASTVEDITAAYTQPIEVTALNPGTFERELPLDSPGDYVVFSASRVAVQLKVDEILVTREFRRVEVEVRNARFLAVPSPKFVAVLVRGPKRLLGSDAEPVSLAAFVDLETKSVGRHTLDVQVMVPEGLEVVQIEPPQVSVTLQAPRRRGSAPQAAR